MQERAHSDECAISSTRKRCRECRNKYKNDSKKRCAKSKADQIIVTRNVTSKKRSKFHDLLCDNCKSKTTRDFCIECKRIYTCSTSKKHRDLIKSRQSIGQSDQTEQPNVINSDQQKQSNKPVSNDSVILENSERINGAIKRKSTYHDVLCNDCKSKNRNEYCIECKSAYKSAKRRKAYLAKKARTNADFQQNHNPTCGSIQGSGFEASADETVNPKTPDTPFGTKEKTLANMKWRFRKFVTKSPTKALSHCVSYINSQTSALQKRAIELIKDNAENEIQDEEDILLEKFSAMVRELKKRVWRKIRHNIYSFIKTVTIFIKEISY